MGNSLVLSLGIAGLKSPFQNGNSFSDCLKKMVGDENGANCIAIEKNEKNIPVWNMVDLNGEKPQFQKNNIFFYGTDCVYYCTCGGKFIHLVCRITTSAYSSKVNESWGSLDNQSANDILSEYEQLPNSTSYFLLGKFNAPKFFETIRNSPFYSPNSIAFEVFDKMANNTNKLKPFNLGPAEMGWRIESVNKGEYFNGRKNRIVSSDVGTADLFYGRIICEGKDSFFHLYLNKKAVSDYYLAIVNCNGNMILNGAPGTGKTFLAHEIAANMLGRISWGEVDNDSKLSSHVGFVQFHPSYDYTDFVEGLRPVNNGSGTPSFLLTPGVFKKFCEEALKDAPYYLMRLIEKKLSMLGSNSTKKELEELEDLISRAKKYIEGREKVIKEQPDTANNEAKNNLNDEKNELEETKNKLQVAKKALEEAKKKLAEEENKSEGAEKKQEGNESKEVESTPEEVRKISELPYVFIIDEINRGEMSKIFGELFFSIDPGYRGTKGKVQTQYASMVDKENAFDSVLDNGKKGQFFVPENVFVIGTMNDIDRSVDSMDFAMRRRFAFREIDPKDNCGMIYEKFESDAEKVIKVMDSLNKVIKEDSGLNLGSEYQIGPSYFLGLKQNNNGEFDWEVLWKSKLEGLLYEYIRGMDDTKTKKDRLETAYKDGQKIQES